MRWVRTVISELVSLLGVAVWCAGLAGCEASDSPPMEQQGDSAANASGAGGTQSAPLVAGQSADMPGGQAGAGGVGLDAVDAIDAGDARDAGAEVACEVALGTYEALYAALSGGCGPIADANRVPVEDSIFIERFATMDVETETVVDGCSVELTQMVRDKMGVPQSKVSGTLRPGSRLDDPTLRGEVILERYEDGDLACQGTYSAVLRRNTMTLGGATP
jgi:hypothetical protein